MDQAIGTFGRQAIPMVWDYAESNAFADMAGDYFVSINNMMRVIRGISSDVDSFVVQADSSKGKAQRDALVATDPPYYDNIGYADLSDFFYVWLRRTLHDRFPRELATVLVPKAEELVATPYRHGGKEAAEAFFMAGMGKALANMAAATAPDLPVTIYYAFKQTEVEKEGITSTGWATFLEAVLAAGFQVDGTWPIRTELGNRMIGRGTNALASSIVLVCRRRNGTGTVTRRDFLRALERELPSAVRLLKQANIAPVDLAQAAIGPGMAIFSRHAAVIEADDSRMSVKTALQLIFEHLDDEPSTLDVDTQWALRWFDGHGFEAGPFGDANTLANALSIGVNGLAEAGIVEAKAGKVRLLRPAELDPAWDPAQDQRATVWEATALLAHKLDQIGETETCDLLARLGPLAEPAKELAYRLYGICNTKKWAQDALLYNNLVVAWPELTRFAASLDVSPPQRELAV